MLKRVVQASVLVLVHETMGMVLKQLILKHIQCTRRAYQLFLPIKIIHKQHN